MDACGLQVIERLLIFQSAPFVGVVPVLAGALIMMSRMDVRA
jgi:hypothetical protein